MKLTKNTLTLISMPMLTIGLVKQEEVEVYHCVYSPEAARLHGWVYYRDINGNEIKVTSAANSAEWNRDSYKWKDKQFAGYGLNYSRPGEEGEWQW